MFQLEVQGVGCYYLRHADIRDETWSVMESGGQYEAACGEYGLGWFNDLGTAIMEVVSDIERRLGREG